MPGGERAAAFSRFGISVPASATFGTTSGFILTNVGTMTNPALSTASHLASVRRLQIASAAGAGSLASLYSATQADVWRGNAAGRGGFLYTARLGLVTMVAGQRGFFGLRNSLNAPTNIDPTTSTAFSVIGIGFNANTGNWQLIVGLAGSSPTLVDLGASFPLNTTDVLEIAVACLPNDTQFYYRVRNLTNGAVAAGTLTTNIPAATDFLSATNWMCNNATASAVAWAYLKLHVEADI